MRRGLTLTTVTFVLLTAALSAAGAVTVEVQAAGTVRGAFVCLGDVALITGDETGGLATLALCSSPLPGESLSVTSERIRRRVVAALGGAEFTLSGQASCRVTRPAAEEPTKPTAADMRPTAPAVAGATLESLIRLYVADRLERSAGDVRVDFDPRDKDVLALSGDTYQFRFIAGSNRVTPGAMVLRVEVYDRASPRLVVRTASVRFTVVLLENVLVATRVVRLGRVITAEDVRVERREFRETPRQLLHEVADIVGATAKRNIDAGQTLTVDDMQKTLMVERGNAVTVMLEGRGFRIKTTCRALESGEMGSAVAVQGVDGRGKFYATVIGPRTVEVRLAGVPAMDVPSNEAAVAETDGRQVAQAAADAGRASANRGEP